MLHIFEKLFFERDISKIQVEPSLTLWVKCLCEICHYKTILWWGNDFIAIFLQDCSINKDSTEVNFV